MTVSTLLQHATLGKSDHSGTSAPMAAAIAPATAAAVTDGRYARTRPTPDYSPGNPTQIRPMAIDPNFSGVNGTGRLWCTDKAHGHIGYTDDDGVTYTPKVAGPSTDSPLAGVVGIYFATDPGTGNKWMFVVTGTSSQTPCSGEVFRSPAPDVNGAGIVLTRIWGANGYARGSAGAAYAPNNATLRNSSFAVDAATGNAGIFTYGSPDTTFQPAALTDVCMGLFSDRLITQAGILGCYLVGTTVTVAGAGLSGADLTTKILAILQVGDGAGQPGIALVSKPAMSAVYNATCTFPNQSYGGGVVQGGPAFYQTPSIFLADPTNISWNLRKQFPSIKHGHSVIALNGAWFISGGDVAAEGPITDGLAHLPYPKFPGVGIWTSTGLNGSVWNQRSLSSVGAGNGTGLDVINMIPVTVNGVPILLCESDGRLRHGPISFATQDPTKTANLIPTCTHHPGLTTTMRTLGIDPATKNAYWAAVTESGAQGQSDCVWMAAPPYTHPILLENTGSTTELSAEVLCDAVISNGYFWLGTNRCTIPTLKGQ